MDTRHVKYQGYPGFESFASIQPHKFLSVWFPSRKKADRENFSWPSSELTLGESPMSHGPCVFTECGSPTFGQLANGLWVEIQRRRPLNGGSSNLEHAR
jgi:hypothetical protein